jgi:hypothetical protein
MTPKRPRDPNQLAKSIIDIGTGQKPDRDPTPEERGKNAVAVSTGSIGGKIRAGKLSAKRRKEIAEKTARARWRASPAKNTVAKLLVEAGHAWAAYQDKAPLAGCSALAIWMPLWRSPMILKAALLIGFS